MLQTAGKQPNRFNEQDINTAHIRSLTSVASDWRFFPTSLATNFNSMPASLII
jgi:hypothetical protein